MMKTTQKTKGTILICIAALLMLAMATGCSRNKSESAISTEDVKGTGSVSFGIQWPASAYEKAGIPSKSSAAAAIETIDCATLGVESVEATITDAQGNVLGTGAWKCSDRRGTINDVAEGSDRKITVLAKDSVGNLVYQGEKAGIRVVGGQDNAIGTVTMNPALQASIDLPATNQTILVGGTVDFAGSATGGTGSYTYSWAIDGGSPNTSASQNPGKVAFNTAGSYTIILTVTDNGSHIGKASIVVNVNESPKLTASIASPMGNQTKTTGDKLTFKGEVSPSAGAYTYQWDFGGAATVDAAKLSTLEPGEVTFNTVSPAAGFTVTFKVTDTATGKTSSASVIIVVNAPPVVYTPPTVSITSPADNWEVLKDDIVNFQGQITPGSMSNLTHEWTISDSTFSNTSSMSMSYQFTTIKTYTVTFKVNDGRTEVSDSTTVLVKGWELSDMYETVSQDSNDAQVVLIDSGTESGRAFAVWCKNDGQKNNIYANCYFPNAGWRSWTNSVIDTSINGAAYKPRIACNRTTGKAMVVFYQYDGAYNSIYANSSDIDGYWHGAISIENNSVPATNPDIAIDNSGNAWAVWCENSTNLHSIGASHYTPTGGWTADETVWSISTSYATDNTAAMRVKVAFDSSGRPIVAWVFKKNDGSYTLYANRYTPGDGWRSDTVKVIGTAGYNVSPDYAQDIELVCDGAGKAFAVWLAYSNETHSDVYANIFSNDSWGDAVAIDKNSGNVKWPHIACDSAGNAVVVWSAYYDTYGVYARHYFAGSGWETEPAVFDLDGQAFNTQVTCDSAGRATAVWRQRDDGAQKAKIMANRYIPGRGWLGPHVVENDDTPDMKTTLQISCNDTCQAIVLWVGGATGTELWAKYFH